MDPSPVKPPSKSIKVKNTLSNVLEAIKHRPHIEIESKKEPHRMIMVYHHPRQVVHIQLKDSVFVTAEMVKSEAGRVLGINDIGLAIFGLFVGEPDYVTKLLGDADVIPHTVDQFSLLRLSFHLDSDRRALKYCEGATDLLFWELRNQFERNKLIPAMSEESTDQITNALRIIDIKTQEWEFRHGILHSQSRGPNIYSEQKQIVLFILESSKACYNYYYRAQKCTTRDILVYVAPRPDSRMEISVALNINEVVFLHSSGKVLYFFPREMIKSIKMQLHPTPVQLFCLRYWCVKAATVFSNSLLSELNMQNTCFQLAITF